MVAFQDGNQLIKKAASTRYCSQVAMRWTGVAARVLYVCLSVSGVRFRLQKARSGRRRLVWLDDFVGTVTGEVIRYWAAPYVLPCDNPVQATGVGDAQQQRSDVMR